MAANLAFLKANDAQFLPNIQESAIKYVFQRFVMASRVRVATDMAMDWNTRNVSEYMPSRRAQELAEDTEIPDTQLLRARLNSVEPDEFGDRYRITERRSGTDPEDIIADSIEALGYSVGSKVEIDLMNAALSTFRGGSWGSSSTDLTMALLNKASVRAYQVRGANSGLYHVLHPYQVEPILEKLLTFTEAQGGEAALKNATNGAVQSFNLPVLGNVAIAPLLPRRVLIQLKVYGTSGTFRLQVGNGYEVGVNITAAISANATAATVATNVKNALEALTFTGNGTWTVDGTGGLLDIRITPPATLYLPDPDQLRAAVKYDEDLHIDGGAFDSNFQKSAYDAVGTLTSAPLDNDGNEMGFTLHEVSGHAKALSFFRDALIYDIRKSPTPFSELTKQGRVLEYSLSTTYAAAGWRPYLGMLITSTASSPTKI